MVLRAEAGFEIARRLRDEGTPLGELFSFLSGLYFRGKLAYATAFTDPPAGCPGVFVVTPSRGLMGPEDVVTRKDLQEFRAARVSEEERGYRDPFLNDAASLANRIGRETDVILLGSIVTGKYVRILLDQFSSQLKFPATFVGRGDMSRGGILLRSVRDEAELAYAPIEGAVLHGKRPPRLAPLAPLRSSKGRREGRK
jgi:hypothetical protein